jgi:hypothetical protein
VAPLRSARPDGAAESIKVTESEIRAAVTPLFKLRTVAFLKVLVAPSLGLCWGGVAWRGVGWRGLGWGGVG